MRDRFTISLQQQNPTLGDLAGNRALAERAVREAGAVDLVAFTELFITGYPPEDLVLRRSFTERAMAEVRELAKAVAGGPAVAVGTPWREEGRLTNAVAVLHGGEVKAVRHKVELPNYDVFDEKRFFAAGPLPGPVDIEGVRIGFPIGEDIWTGEVVDCLAETGTDILVVPTGSPFTRAKQDARMSVAVARVVESSLPLVYVNQVGGQDELVFDGASFVLSPSRALALQLPAFQPAARTIVFSRAATGWTPEPGAIDELPDLEEAEWRAATTALRDHVDKNGFAAVVVGLSGGIDTALCAALAVDALGPDRVQCVTLPDRAVGDDSLADAAELATRLGVRHDVIPIAPALDALYAQLGPSAGALPDVTEETVRSHVRGTALMAIAHRTGAMVVAAGNKSEVSVGYATLYGDMIGGFNPIKDLYKTEVYRLCRWRNAHRPAGALGPEGGVIPQRVIERPPAAELREAGKEADALPPYATLDAILKRLIEDEASVAEIVHDGFDAAVVRRVEDLLHRAETMRRQSAPGVKISTKTFGRDRRYPITNRFRDA